MKKKIDLKILIIFNLIILYFYRNFLFTEKDIENKDIILIVIIGIIAIILNVIVILLQKLELSAVKKFLIISILIGTIYIFLSPLLHGIDETAHFSRIYSFFLDSSTTDSGEYLVPKKISIVGNLSAEHFNNFSFLNTKINNNDLIVDKNLVGARLYTPLSYLPYLLPVLIFGFLIKSSIFSLVIASRFSGFLLYLIVCVFAIKTVPKRKEFMALFCLMPSIISSAATINADLLTNLSIILFISIWFKLFYLKKQITIKEIVVIIIAGILAGYSKMIYSFEFLLVVFLPKECFGESRKRKIKIICIIVGAILIATLINVIISANSMNSSYEGLKLQKDFIISKPIKFLVILSSSILKNYNYIYSFTTNFTILHNVYYPQETGQILYFIALLICLFKEKVNINLKKLIQFAIIGIGIFVIVVIYVSLYLQWTSERFGAGVPFIEGMQSRYYIPVMLMFLICLPSQNEYIKIDENIPWYISLSVNISILLKIMFIVF